MIKSIEIKNFKSIKNDKINLSNFCVIIGRNAAGKTNLIQAINFIRKLSLGENINLAQKEICLMPQELFNLNESSKELSLCVNIEINNGKEYRLEIVIGLKDNKNSFPELFISHEKLEEIIESNSRIIFERKRERLKNEDKREIPLNVSCDKLAISVYKNNDVEKVKKFLSNIFIAEQEIINLREPITNSDDSLANLVRRLSPKDKEDYIKIIGQILPDFSSFKELGSTKENKIKKSSTEEKYCMILLKEKNLSGILSMESISTGDLRTLYLIARAMNMEKGSSLFIEEVENGMHPNRLVDLLDYLEKISVRKEIQIIFTTHSSYIINSIKPTNIVFVKKDISEGTKFELLQEHKEIGAIQDYLNKGGELLDYINSRIN